MDQIVQIEPKKKTLGKTIGYIILVLILLLVGVQYFNAARYEAQVQVIEEDRIGVNPTDQRLDFGDLPRDKNAKRVVTLTNNSPYRVKSYVIVWTRGEISDFMNVNPNFFTLEPGIEAKVEFGLHIPNSAEYRYYKGKVVIFQLPKIW